MYVVVLFGKPPNVLLPKKRKLYFFPGVKPVRRNVAVSERLFPWNNPHQLKSFMTLSGYTPELSPVCAPNSPRLNCQLFTTFAPTVVVAPFVFFKAAMNWDAILFHGAGAAVLYLTFTRIF